MNGSQVHIALSPAYFLPSIDIMPVITSILTIYPELNNRTIDQIKNIMWVDATDALLDLTQSVTLGLKKINKKFLLSNYYIFNYYKDFQDINNDEESFSIVEPIMKNIQEAICSFKYYSN